MDGKSVDDSCCKLLMPLDYWWWWRWWYRLRLGFRFHISNRLRRAKGLNFAHSFISHINRFLSMTCQIDLICLVHHIFCSIKLCWTCLVFARRPSFIQGPVCIDQCRWIVRIGTSVIGSFLHTGTPDHQTHGEYGDDKYEHSACCNCFHFIPPADFNCFHSLNIPSKNLYSFSPRQRIIMGGKKIPMPGCGAGA